MLITILCANLANCPSHFNSKIFKTHEIEYTPSSMFKKNYIDEIEYPPSPMWGKTPI